ncbi:LOW QUALITY PROTEIN: craniofacial development protein 1 [Drosophila eugracilis]|uniref:LOW QUALITY PROTEIN: craniofacial development protein 1 n=1 Tax=Drosophila eugracilis TaxID=29029 RepID=UPI001BDB5955|nr:LOW QUALITY PROTEIN: craniofacial development protein 1 [Drosophila eugracilis]
MKHEPLKKAGGEKSTMMNLEENNLTDCETDEDYFPYDGSSNDKSGSDESNAIREKNFYTKSKKHTGHAFRITRQSSCSKNDIRRIERNELQSEEEADTSRSDVLWDNFLTKVESEEKINKQTEHDKETDFNVNSKPELTKIEVKRTLNVTANKEKRTIPIVSSRLSTLKSRLNESAIGSFMNNFPKKRKLSVLEKSQLDWKNFKIDEGIDEQLRAHNRGKEGYLERQDFLQRTDLRQFEIEKNLRHPSRSN